MARPADRSGTSSWAGVVDALPLILLCIAVAESTLLLLDYTSGLNFWGDEWSFVIYRRAFSAPAFFLPHGEHISVLPVAVYKLLMSLFGLTSTTPYRIVSVVVIGVAAFVVFAYLRRRVGDWLALLACVGLVFLGAAWQDLLWPFEMSLVGSLVSGIGMLLALERRDRRGDLTACGLLTISILCSSLGVSFLLAAIVEVAQRRSEWRGRAFVPAIPGVIYVVWYVTYGYMAEHHVTVHNVLTSPIYLVNGVAAALQSFLGLMPALGAHHHVTWGWVALAALVVAVAVHLRRGPRPRPELWPLVAAAASFWLLAGANYSPGRSPTESRYQYIGVAFVLMILAEVFHGARLRRPAAWAGVVAVVGLAVWSGLHDLDRGRLYLREQTALSRADLGAIEVARRTVDPDFDPTMDVAGPVTLPLTAGPYLAAADALGSPADTPAELAAAPDIARAWGDDVLGHALPVTLGGSSSRSATAGPAPMLLGGAAAARVRGACVDVPPAATAKGAVFAPAGPTTLIRVPRGPLAIVQMRRFATGSFPFTAGGVDGGTTGLLRIPPDRVARPWRVRVTAKQGVTMCNASGP